MENVSENKVTTERKLIVKTYGNNAMSIMLNVVNSSTPLEQSLIAHEASKFGLSPRLFGADEIGRVEEYIECRTLKHEEAFRDEIAIAFARFHSLEVPMTRDRSLGRERGDLVRMKQTYDKILNYSIEKGIQIPAVENILKEFQWFQSAGESIGIKHRTVLVTGDPNYMNILVLNSPRENQLPVMLIDFDCTCYSWRGIELGGHFVCQLVNFKDITDFKTDFLYPDESTQRSFLNTYLNEWKRLNVNLIHDEMDCLENLLKESYFGAMFVCLLWCWFRYCLHHDNLDKLEENFFTIEPKTLQFYQQVKELFQQKYLNK